MARLIEGRGWRFGDRVTTDEILPGRYLDLGSDEVARFAMAGADPTFAARVRPGDIVVAGFEYQRKEWCGLEFRASKELIMERQDRRVISGPTMAKSMAFSRLTAI